MTHFSFSSGLINIPAVALGIFSGGIVMKKFRISIRGAAKLYLGSSVLGYLLFLSLFALGCENSDVAGLTISYQGYVYSLSNQRRSVCLTKLIMVFQDKIIKLLRTYLWKGIIVLLWKNRQCLWREAVVVTKICHFLWIWKWKQILKNSKSISFFREATW